MRTSLGLMGKIAAQKSTSPWAFCLLPMAGGNADSNAMRSGVSDAKVPLVLAAASNSIPAFPHPPV